MDQLKILIVEDEFIIAENLKQMLEEMGYDLIYTAGSMSSAHELLTKETPDLVLLDIHLKNKLDGIEVGKVLNEKSIPFIYITSNADKKTVDLAKQTNPKSYLIKPFTKEDIYATIEVAIANLGEQKQEAEESYLPALKNSLFIKSGSKYLKVKIEDITHFESDGKFLHIHTVHQQKLEVRNSLEAMLNQLKDKGFIRVHRSFCINSAHLTAINAENVFIGNQPIPIGRNYKEDLLKRLNTLS